MPVEPRGLSVGMFQVDKKGVPLEQEFQYGRSGKWSPYPRIGKEGEASGETLHPETETGPKGEARTEIPVLHIV